MIKSLEILLLETLAHALLHQRSKNVCDRCHQRVTSKNWERNMDIHGCVVQIRFFLTLWKIKVR